MKNYFFGIAFGICLTLVFIYTGVINVATPAHSINITPRPNKVLMEAGLLSGIQTDFSSLNGSAEVIHTEPLTEMEACNRVSNYQKTNSGKDGLFLTKSLIENLFAGNQHNGLRLFLEMHTSENGLTQRQISSLNRQPKIYRLLLWKTQAI